MCLLYQQTLVPRRGNCGTRTDSFRWGVHCLVQQGKFMIGTFMQKSCRNNASPACQTTHVCDPTEPYSISNHTGNAFAFALLLRKPRLGWAGVGPNLTSGARVAVDD